MYDKANCLFVIITVMLLIDSSAAQPAKDRFENATAGFQKVIAAARAEGDLSISAVTANTVPPARIELFRKLTGVNVHVTIMPAAQSFARLNAEKASGKLSMDVRMSGFDHESFALRSLGHAEGFGELPNTLDPDVPWAKNFHPLREGAVSLIYRAFGWSMVINRDTLPDGPKSWKDLADPKFKGQIIWYDPTVDGMGCTSFFGLVDIYGMEWGKAFLGNIAAVTRVPFQSDRQVARGEFGISGPSVATTMGALSEIPEPRPFYLLHPADGVIVNPSAVTLLKEAPHPNAGRVWANFLLSREAQQSEADNVGGGAIRQDVNPAVPEYALTLSDKVLRGFPVSEQFTYEKKCSETVPTILTEIGLSWRQ
jgi:iron(III) transport system substrate-binding protein